MRCATLALALCRYRAQSAWSLPWSLSGTVRVMGAASELKWCSMPAKRGLFPPVFTPLILCLPPLIHAPRPCNVQVVAINKRFLDPRRPTKPTAADREEGLIRYSEVIPILPSDWVTQHRVVHDIRGLVTAPAELESNIHFLAFGLDLFYARITPSQSFDALDDDFNHVLLSLTLVALVAGVVVARRVADANELHHAWR